MQQNTAVRDLWQLLRFCSVGRKMPVTQQPHLNVKQCTAIMELFCIAISNAYSLLYQKLSNVRKWIFNVIFKKCQVQKQDFHITCPYLNHKVPIVHAINLPITFQGNTYYSYNLHLAQICVDKESYISLKTMEKKFFQHTVEQQFDSSE